MNERPVGTHDEAAKAEDRPPRLFIARSLIRVVLIIAALLFLYYALPLDGAMDVRSGLIVLVGLAVLAVVTARQVRAITRSPHPAARAANALAFAIPFFIIVFATVYYVMASHDAQTFTQPLSRTDSLYLTITVLSTVGFGDITAKTETARLTVSVQMMLDLVLLGLVAHTIVGTARERLRQERGVDHAAGGPAADP